MTDRTIEPVAGAPTLLRNAGNVIAEYMDLLFDLEKEDEDEYCIAAKVRDALYAAAGATEQESEC